jgi:class 3 adenylate cyclase
VSEALPTGTVTFLFSDIEGSSDLARSVGDKVFAAGRADHGPHPAESHSSGEGYVGIGVHSASRICEAARGSQIVFSNAPAGIIEDAELPGIELVDLGTHRLKGLPRAQRLFQVTVEGLPSRFDRPRTDSALAVFAALSEGEEPVRVYEICEAQA